ncbi:MAG: hypothetical protein KQH59_03610 [Desulfobulbaceae bacterium]|nr:hypothetical protein [Desulfobulbaceae bacterium]
MKIKRIVYYFDKVVLNTELEKEIVKNRLFDTNILDHCKKYSVSKSTKLAKLAGYNTRIIVSDASHSIFHCLSNSNLERIGISRLEIARDVGLRNFIFATNFMRYMHKHYERRWSRKGFIYKGELNDTIYIGKSFGEYSSNYSVIYPINNDKNPFGNYAAIHMEFVLLNWKKIKEQFKISSIAEVPCPREAFNYLKKRYIKVNNKLNNNGCINNC